MEATTDALPAATKPHANKWTYRWRVWESLLYRWRPYFWSGIMENLGNPVLYLLALGLGLGSLIDARPSEALGGLTYAQFIAPAILCAATLNIAFSESSFGLFADLKWQRTLWGRLATPISPRIAADGYLLFITTRLTFTATTYYLVLTLFGLNGGWWGLLAIPVGIFHGLAVGVWVMTLTLHITKPDPTAFNLALRFGIIPMTLFSATYFPLSQLPGWAQIAAQASPLLHANELARGAILHNLSAGQIAWHLGFITVLFIVGRHVMIRSFIKRTVI